jgi:hypothetical protein
MVVSAKLFEEEASHWMRWSAEYVTGRNDAESYSDGHGKHTNWVGSYFSRLRRMVGGQRHHVSHRYLHQYANHAAWLEDHRRWSNGGNAHQHCWAARSTIQLAVWGLGIGSAMRLKRNKHTFF